MLSLSVPPEHLQWVLGVDSQTAALKKLEGFRLDGIVQKMKCPFLLLHGEGDEQISLSLAHTCFDAVGSKQKTFKVFTARGGRLPSLPGRQHHHRRPRHVGLDRDVLKPGRCGCRDRRARNVECKQTTEIQGPMTQPLYITEAEVARLVTVKDAIAALEEMFACWGDPLMQNLPRQRAKLPVGAFNHMGASYGAKKIYGLKAYAGGKGSTQGHVLIYSNDDFSLKAMIECDLLGQTRTGAASGLATKLLANPDARTLGVIGTGRQSRAQVMAVCAVRPIERVLVFVRTAASREAYAREMEKDARHRGTAGADRRGLRRRGRRDRHHHQVGRAGVPRRLAQEGLTHQRGGREFG